MGKSKFLLISSLLVMSLFLMGCDSSGSSEYKLNQDNLIGSWTTYLGTADFTLNFTDSVNFNASGDQMFSLSGKSGTWTLADDVISITVEGTVYDITVLDFSEEEMEVSSVDLYGSDSPFVFESSGN